MNKSDKDYILNSFFERIESINDIEYQRRVWIEGKGPECDDFDETVNCFFDEGKYILNHYKDFSISESQLRVLQLFSAEFKKFSRSIGRDYLPEIFIDTPEWTGITEMAKEVLKAFHWKKTNLK